MNGLESRGVQLLDQLLPGLVAGLAAEGASLIDDLSQMHYRLDGVRIAHRPTPINPFLLVSRPFLERAVRRRVAAMPGVLIRDRLEVARLLHRPGGDGQVVSGVQVTPVGGGASEDIPADLVLDATGRGSRTPLWLDELGYPRPVEQVIPVQISYATRSLRLPDRPDGPELPPFLIEGTTEHGATGITLFRCEQGRTLFGVSGPRDVFPSRVTSGWMLRVAAGQLPPPALEAVQTACAADDAGPIAVYQVPSSVWRRYDRMSSFPSGLLVLGDALCSFNPVYGQGMSVAAGQALALRQVLKDDPVAAFPLRFFAATTRPTVQAWRLTSGSDREHAGGANLRQRATRWATGKLMAQTFRVAERDATVARVLTGMTGLSERRTALLRPRVLVPVTVSGSVLAVRRLASASARGLRQFGTTPAAGRRTGKAGGR